MKVNELVDVERECEGRTEVVDWKTSIPGACSAAVLCCAVQRSACCVLWLGSAELPASRQAVGSRQVGR